MMTADISTNAAKYKNSARDALPEKSAYLEKHVFTASKNPITINVSWMGVYNTQINPASFKKCLTIKF